MRVVDLINKLFAFERDNLGQDVANFHDQSLGEDEYFYDDDYWSGDEGEAIYSFPKSEIPPFNISPRALELIGSGKGFGEVFNNCSIYFYGYDNGCVEIVLSRNIKIGGYPFENIVCDHIASGLATRFEIVSNDDLLCFMGGGVGNTTEYPLLMSNVAFSTGSTLTVCKFEVEF